jgi:hypothetical protein
VVRAAITHDANHRNGFIKLFVENIPVAKRGAGSFILEDSLTPTQPHPVPSPKERGKELSSKRRFYSRRNAVHGRERKDETRTSRHKL